MKKILCGIIAILMLSVSAFAVELSDIKGHWSESYVNRMVQGGYVSGYDDGTFRPEKSISHMEAVLLASRMLGVNDGENATTVHNAQTQYAVDLAGYGISFKKEVEYLLYLGVLDKSDLDDYIGDTVANKPLKRYEAAILITKLLGAEDEINRDPSMGMPYGDIAEIPTESRGYVMYVKEQSIMEGMGKDNTGKPKFSPNTAVTRGQMAKILSGLIDIIDLRILNGEVAVSDGTTLGYTVNGVYKSVDLSEKVIIKADAEDVSASSLKVGTGIKIILLKNEPVLIEKTSEPDNSDNKVDYEDETPEDKTGTGIKGVVQSINEEAGQLTIYDPADKTDVSSYKVAEDAEVKKDGKYYFISAVKKGDYIEIKNVNGRVKEIAILDKNETFSGTVQNTRNVYPESITIASDGKRQTFIITEEIELLKNGEEADIWDIIIGEEATVKLVYGKAKEIYVVGDSDNTSINSDYKGEITEIRFRKNETVVGLTVNGAYIEYALDKNAEIIIDGDFCDKYDLRVGSQATIEILSSKIIKIEIE